MQIEKSVLVIRNMMDCPYDFKLMVQWLTEPHVSKFYGNPLNLDQVTDKYLPRIKGNGEIVPCIVEYDGSPIGYLQYYPLNETQKLELKLCTNIPIYGLDLLIGTPQYLNKGIGTEILMAVLDYLKDIGIKKVVLDPQVDNTRAIRCYEKCGFKRQRILPHHQYHDGVYFDCWLMDKDLSGIKSGGHVL